MPKQFRLKITLWAIFFFTHPQKRLYVNKIFAPCFHSLLFSENRVVWYNQESHRVGEKRTQQLLMQLSFVTAKRPENKQTHSQIDQV